MQLIPILGFQFYLWLSLTVLILSACSSAPSLKENSGQPAPLVKTSPRKNLSLIYSGNRYLEVEPCDCAIKKLGGIDREANVLTKWRNATIGESYFFAGGTNLVPTSKLYETQDTAVYLARARYVVESLNFLGLTALSPSAEDLALPLEEIRKLQSKAIFPFISSNLYSIESQQPLFSPFLELRHDGIRIFVIGLTGAPDPKFSIDPDVFIVEPELALAALLVNLPKNEPTVIVLLSSLSNKQRQQVLRKFPQINIVLGASYPTAPKFAIKQLGKSTLYLHPTGLGRTLAKLELELKTPIISFFNTWIATQTKDRRRIWEDRRKETQSKLASNSLSNEDREELLLKQIEYEQFLKQSTDIPLQANPSYVRYNSTILEVDESFDLPQNDLTELLARHKEAIQKALSAPKETPPPLAIPVEPHGPPEKPLKNETVESAAPPTVTLPTGD